MSHLTRRGLLIGGAGVAAVALQPEIAHAITPTTPTTARTVPFTLNATVLDGGEQVTSLTLDTNRFGLIDPASLTSSTFAVHLTSSLPFGLPTGETLFKPYTNVERPVTKARLDHGKIVLDLFTIDQSTPGGTLGYMLNAGRNVMMKQVYTITQTAPLKLLKGGSLTLPGFTQGKLVDPEVDVYSYHKSKDGMNYRLFSPSHDGRSDHWDRRDKSPLIVWLHGGGEGVSCQRTTTTMNRRSARTAVLSASRPPRRRKSSAAHTATTGWCTAGEVHRRLGRASDAGVRRVLERLVEQGIVTADRSHRFPLYVLNRDHVAARYIESLARLRGDVVDRIRGELEQWTTPPLHASLFGSFARGEADEASDIDILLVRLMDWPKAMRSG